MLLCRHGPTQTFWGLVPLDARRLVIIAELAWGSRPTAARVASIAEAQPWAFWMALARPTCAVAVLAPNCGAAIGRGCWRFAPEEHGSKSKRGCLRFNHRPEAPR